MKFLNSWHLQILFTKVFELRSMSTNCVNEWSCKNNSNRDIHWAWWQCIREMPVKARLLLSRKYSFSQEVCYNMTFREQVVRTAWIFDRDCEWTWLRRQNSYLFILRDARALVFCGSLSASYCSVQPKWSHAQ